MLTPRVIKVGGRHIEDASWLAGLGRAVTDGAPCVVVHGGGHAITRRQEELGFRVVRNEGLRHTPPELAVVVSEVLCGPVRRLLVDALRASGASPSGLAGFDGLFEVALVDEAGLGMVGTVTAVDAARVRGLLATGVTPVVAPVSRLSDGRLVNVNADDAAVAVAAALDAELTLVSDVPGVLVEGAAVRELDDVGVASLIEGGLVSEGMVAKLRSICRAGVTARIGDLEALMGRGGTVVAPQPAGTPA